MSKAQFRGLAAAASNLGRARRAYTEDMFREDFPQFFRREPEEGCFVPGKALEGFLGQASEAIQADRWGALWRYACGLYTAHCAALFLRTYAPEGSATAAEAAATGALVGVVSAAKLGQDSVSYDTDALTKATADWGDWNATQYGQLLAARARLVGMGGSYII